MGLWQCLYHGQLPRSYNLLVKSYIALACKKGHSWLDREWVRQQTDIPRHLHKILSPISASMLSWYNSASKYNIQILRDNNILVKYLSFLFALFRWTIIPNNTAERSTVTPNIIQVIFAVLFLPKEVPPAGLFVGLKASVVTEGYKTTWM